MTSIYEAQVNLVGAWARDPVRFAYEALKIKKLSRQQTEGLNELRKLVWAKIRLAEGGTLSGEDPQTV